MLNAYNIDDCQNMPMPLPVKHSICTHDLELWPMTLETFSAIPIHMNNICGKFNWNPSTK